MYLQLMNNKFLKITAMVNRERDIKLVNFNSVEH